ncbi:Uncharacterised protein [Salmonella enterica subsp. enterica serovar Typhi]|nr:Uncharacterised protein [Salmonella enterica subsp. enterica serovar Typhi]
MVQKAIRNSLYALQKCFKTQKSLKNSILISKK